jgi:hypothetical protein
VRAAEGFIGGGFGDPSLKRAKVFLSLLRSSPATNSHHLPDYRDCAGHRPRQSVWRRRPVQRSGLRQEYALCAWLAWFFFCHTLYIVSWRWSTNSQPCLAGSLHAQFLAPRPARTSTPSPALVVSFFGGRLFLVGWESPLCLAITHLKAFDGLSNSVSHCDTHAHRQ